MNKKYRAHKAVFGPARAEVFNVPFFVSCKSHLFLREKYSAHSVTIDLFVMLECSSDQSNSCASQIAPVSQSGS